MAADQKTGLVEASMEICVASRELAQTSRDIMENSHEALRSSIALLARTDRQVRWYR